jgi:putative DNA methylase
MNQVMANRKLIEVALPLDAINAASAREKSIRHGHPSTLHLWWARRPLAAARAVIFAQMVDDPSAYVDELLADTTLRRQAEGVLEARLAEWQERRAEAEALEAAGNPGTDPGASPTLAEVIADLERQRLFRLIEELVLWENTTNEPVLERARAEIRQSWRRTCAANATHPRAAEIFDPDRLPAFHDPFAGGGALPLEAQRLGLESHATDLNPVAVLINKAMIEIPPRFAGRPPVNPQSRGEQSLLAREWKGAQGLAEDVRHYGQWMRDEAEKRIGHLYPKVEVTLEMARERPDLKPYVGRKLTVIAWLWARTVKSPNPAFANVEVPLASTFMLSTKAGKEAYVEPIIEGSSYRFTVKVGKPKDGEATKLGTTAGKRAAFRCLMSGVPLTYDHIRAEGQAGRMGARLMAIVVEGDRGRVYLSPTPEHEAAALEAKPEWKPDCALPVNPRDFKTPNYGLMTFGDLFTPRQLVALTTFSDLVQEARERVQRDALAAGLPDDTTPLRDGGTGAVAYAETISIYWSFALSKVADRGSSLTRWMPTRDSMYNTFSRQALPMSWDYVEVNSIGQQTGGFAESLRWTIEALEGTETSSHGVAFQLDVGRLPVNRFPVFSTDPPYYDNIGYADLSDFFYVWLRRTLRPIFPDLFATLAVPKAEELVATPYRHGSKEKAEAFFLDGMTRAMHRISEQSHPAFPATIYYAFKQAESEGDTGTSSTGWETFLDAVLRAGFAVSGTWPVRTELGNRLIGKDTNALASSIVLVCRARAVSAPTATRREFVGALKAELPVALAHLQRGNIAPVDLAQAAIGPGMAVYTRYAKVLDAEGRPLGVREALALINQTLDEALAEQEGDFDADSRWALAWFDQHGFEAGDFGVANVLAQAKNTGMNGLMAAGILESRQGKVRLYRPSELTPDWDPDTDTRLTHWETVHHLIRVLEVGGERPAALLVAKLGAKAETARELAYRLYATSERRRRAADALSYNALVQVWPELLRQAREGGEAMTGQGSLFAGDA